MAGVTFVPTYQGLTPVDLVRPARMPRIRCFPFDAPDRIAFYRARNAIYHLFRALAARRPRLRVIAPDYNSGNEILALRAAGATIHYCHVDRQMRMDPAEITPDISALARPRTFADPHTAPRLTRSVTVDCVESESQFSALRPQWDALLLESRANAPFLTWEWLTPWWRHLRGNAALRLVVVRAGHELVAVAPLMLRRQFGVLDRHDFLGIGDAGSDYLDVIARQGRETAAIDAIAAFLRARQITTRLTHVPQNSTAALLAERLSVEGWTSSTAPDGVFPVVPLAGHTWDSYLSSLGASHRANVRRRLKQLSSAFDVRFDRVSTDADRGAALEALARWHGPRFAARGGSTAFSTPALRAFHEEATRHALDRGWLRMYVLRLDNGIAAVMYGLLYERRFYFYQHSFDDTYRRFSTGLVLMALSIRAALDEGAEAFDMLWGTEPYKALWARERLELQRIHLFPPRMSGHLHRGALAVRQHLGQIARGWSTAEEGPRGT